MTIKLVMNSVLRQESGITTTTYGLVVVPGATLESATFTVDLQCLTGPAGVRSLPCHGLKSSFHACILATMQDWEPQLLQQYATDYKLRFRATLLNFKL